MRKNVSARWWLVAALAFGQTLILIGCSLPTRPVSPTGRYGQVSVTVQTNAAASKGVQWPLLVVRSVLTGEEHLLRRQAAAVLDSVHYSGRVPPGRFRLLGLLSSPTAAARKVVLSKSLGNFDVTVNELCQLGGLLHWQQTGAAITRSTRPANQKSCWNDDDQDRQRSRSFAERQQELSPPASLRSGPILRHSGLLSYRSNRKQTWQIIDSGAVNITAAAVLSPNELLIGGEQGLLIYSKNGKQQRLHLIPADSVVLALMATTSGVAMLISTRNALQLLHTRDINNNPWKVVATNDSGYQKVATGQVRWYLAGNRYVVETAKGKHLFTAELP